MFTKKTAAIAAAALLLSLPAGVAMAADDEAVTEAPVVTCDQEQIRTQLRQQIHDPAVAGDAVRQATMTQQRQQLRLDQECDGSGLQEGYGPFAGQGNGSGIGAGAAVRSQARADGTCGTFQGLGSGNRAGA